MGKKIFIGASSALILLMGILIWRLDIPNWKALDLNLLYAQPRSTIVYDAYEESIGTLATEQVRLWASLTDIPEQVRNVFIAAEDQRFYEHNGVNVRRILGALLANLRSRNYSQGASTITQQLIKLTHLSETKTLARKAQEAWLALQLERKLSKDEILECYLNTIYFGSGAYGICSAAKTYFDKDVADLTLAEAALLAGIIKAPSNYAPHLNAERSIQRRDLILNAMAECNYITSQQADNAKKEALRLDMKKEGRVQYGWFMDSVLDETSDLLAMTVDEILSAGYSIHTTFDPILQNAADMLFNDASNFPVGAGDGTDVQAAFVAMRPETGEICAIVGGREYSVQRGLNRATQIRRSPGSAIKPISSYAAAIDAYNFTPTSLVEDTPREFGSDYAPGNAGGHSYGTVTLREALARSLNIATVDLADLIGMKAVRNYALRFGLELDPEDNNLSLALGSMTHGVSPSSLCGAYAVLANGGIKVTPHFISRIEDADGNELYCAESSTNRVVQDSTAYMITDMLKTAVSSGSAKALSNAVLPVAAKTGTVSDSDGSTRDIWTAAYTPDLAMCVWMGFDSPNSDHKLSSSEGGSGYPARFLSAFLRDVRTHLTQADFLKPESVRTALIDSVALENNDVLLATEKTPADCVVQELFHANNLPQQFSENWTAPDQITDLQLLSDSGETPILQFTATDSNAEYLVLRTVGTVTDIATTLTGEPNEKLRFADTEADLSETIFYSILPRNRLLSQRGTLLSGKESAAVTYSPGGIMNLFFGSGETEATPEPADIELNESQSLFG